MSWPDSPGLHDGVPDGVYHAHKALGSSGIADLLDCPATYRYHADVPESHKDTEATELGTAVHTYVLEGEAAFLSRYHITPPGFTMAAKVKDKVNVDACAAAMAAGKRRFAQDDYDVVRHIADAVRACPDAAAILDASEACERSALFTREGVPCKARFDVDAVTSMALVADLKSAADPRPHRFLTGDMGVKRAIQASHYTTAYLLAGGDSAPDFAWIVVPVEPPFTRRVWVAQASDGLLKHGDGLIRRALATYKDAVARNAWDGYDNEIRMMEPPAYWAKEEDRG